MKILIAVDGSESSDVAVEEVSKRPWSAFPPLGAPPVLAYLLPNKVIPAKQAGEDACASREHSTA